MSLEQFKKVQYMNSEEKYQKWHCSHCGITLDNTMFQQKEYQYDLLLQSIFDAIESNKMNERTSVQLNRIYSVIESELPSNHFLALQAYIAQWKLFKGHATRNPLEAMLDRSSPYSFRDQIGFMAFGILPSNGSLTDDAKQH
jgi:hypothetical protein